MAIALKEKNEQTKPAARAREEEEERDSFPFVYGYDADGYLVSDGQPMAEHDIHRKQMTNCIEGLEAHFSDRIAYVSGNNFIHYKEGDRKKHISPDCYVVFDVPQAIRPNYKPWEHGGKTPAIVFEFTSEDTKDEDEGKKFRIYERILNVPEYILFDPRGDYLDPNLKGYRLNAAGHYEPIPIENGRMYSEQLDLYLEPKGHDLRIFDLKTGEYLRTPAESEQQRVIAERERRAADLRAAQEAQRADAEAQARREIEAKMARLMEEMELLRRNQENAN